jgi:hypothetical protein
MTLKIENEEHLASVRTFADKIGLRDQLEEQLKYLDGFGGDRDRSRCRLFKDFAPYSFEFLIERRSPEGEYHRWINGGLIFNAGDGSFPTLSVSLSPTTGWSVHT